MLYTLEKRASENTRKSQFYKDLRGFIFRKLSRTLQNGDFLRNKKSHVLKDKWPVLVKKIILDKAHEKKKTQKLRKN